MRKTFLSIMLIFFFWHNSNAQFIDLNIPLSINARPEKYMTGYYHPGLNQIVINVENRNGITHFFYDTSFVLQKQYDVLDGRTLTKSTKKEFFLEKICIQNTFLEVYAFRDSIDIFRLDNDLNIDIKITSIHFGKNYEDEKLVAVMPNEKGCNILSVSLKNKKVIVYKWKMTSNVTVAKEIELPRSTLTREELKDRGDFLEIKYKNLFSGVSVRHTNGLGGFKFPSASQLFYNDSCIYILNKISYQTGINEFKIDIEAGKVYSINYFINKVITDTQAKYMSVPVATAYDSLLIIQNSSPKIFEYYYYNIINGKLITKFETKPDNSLYSLVHSPLQQIGSFGSSAEEKELDNEKLFIKRKNSGFPFITGEPVGDSLVLTFGSFVPTQGAEGMLLSFATMGFGMGAGIGVAIGDIRIIPYLTSSRNKFLYAHSKFSLKGLQPSIANNTRTCLDDFLADNKLKDLGKSNSFLLELPGKLIFGLYNKETKKYNIAKFQQH